MKKKTQKYYDDLEYEESVRIDKIWKDKDLQNKDPTKLHYREHQILSQRVFADGYVIEAVVILHGLLEWELNQLWMMFVICNNPENIENTVNLKEKSYLDLISLCNELGLFDDESKDIAEGLKEFNKLRNSLSHNFYGVNQKTIPKTQINKKFERGLNISGTIPLLELKYLYKESKKNPFAKKILKVLENDV